MKSNSIAIRLGANEICDLQLTEEGYTSLVSALARFTINANSEDLITLIWWDNGKLALDVHEANKSPQIHFTCNSCGLKHH